MIRKLSLACLLFAFAPCQPSSLKAESVPLPRLVSAQPGKQVAAKGAVAAKAAQPKPLPTEKADPELIGATTFEYLAEFKVRNVPQGTAVIWDIYPDDAKTVTRIIKVEKAVIVAGPPREYSVKVRLVKGEDVTEFKKVFRITGGSPVPIDPKVDPIDPKVDPKPIDPKVEPPITEPGFRVLIVYQDAIKHRYSQTQKDLIFGDEFRDYLRSKAVLGADGKTPEVRIWDVDVQGVQNETPLWQKAFARPRIININGTPTDAVSAGYLWLIVSNGKEGWEGPVGPNDSYADILARVKKIGG